MNTPAPLIMAEVTFLPSITRLNVTDKIEGLKKRVFTKNFLGQKSFSGSNLIDKNFSWDLRDLKILVSCKTQENLPKKLKCSS